MEKLFFILKYYRLYKHWKKVKSGAKTIEFERGCGYYLNVSLLGYSPIGKIEEFEMKSGRVGLYELVDYTTYRDPYDMVKESSWHFIGYKDDKAIKDCTFNEMMSIYFPDKI